MSGSELWGNMLLLLLPLLAASPDVRPVAGVVLGVEELLVAGAGAVPGVVRAGDVPGVGELLIVGPGVGLSSPKMLSGTMS